MSKSQQLRIGAGQLNSWLLGLLAFALPLSTSAVSAVALLILLLWLIEGRFREKAAELDANPVALAVLGYLVLLCLGLLWTKRLTTGLDVLRAHWKLALLPVFMTAARPPLRSFYLYSFLAGVTAAMLLTFLVWLGLVQYADVSPTHLTPKTFHVVYNPLLAFAIYLALHEAVWWEKKKAERAILFALAGLMSFNMFLTEGRTGQAVFLVLITLFLFQVFSKNKIRAALMVCLLLPAICAAGYAASPVFRQRAEIAWQEVSRFRENPNTSVGLRLQFWQNTLVMIKGKPWTGVGTGDFHGVYAKINWQKSRRCPATDNPHNQYLLTTAMLGLPGLISLLLIFAAMFAQARLSADGQQRLRIAFPVFFLVIMLAESYLKVFQTAFLFALFAAVLYKKSNETGT
jgi:O-antigen ligase